jgi:glutamate synthase domain-containing protein 3
MEERLSRTHEINKAILKQSEISKKIKIGGAGLNGQDNIAVGLTKEVELIVDGTAGDFFGAMNSSAVITLTGNVARFLGDCISGGGIIVTGNCDFGAGTYMSGGVIVIRGNAGDNAGQMKRAGAMIIDGDAGINAAFLMAGGDMIITGDCAEALGDLMTGGAIYIGGTYSSLGRNAKTVEMGLSDVNLLDTYFKHYGISSKSTTFRKIVPASPDALGAIKAKAPATNTGGS